MPILLLADEDLEILTPDLEWPTPEDVEQALFEIEIGFADSDVCAEE